MSTENNNNNQQNSAEDKNKIAKQYEATLKKLVAVVGGQENVYGPKRVPNDTLGTLVNDLLKERKEKLASSVKVELTELLDKKVALDKEIKAKEEELAKLKQNKQKEFNEAASKVFGKIEGIEQLEKDYYSSLTTTVETPTEKSE